MQYSENMYSPFPKMMIKRSPYWKNRMIDGDMESWAYLTAWSLTYDWYTVAIFTTVHNFTPESCAIPTRGRGFPKKIRAGVRRNNTDTNNNIVTLNLKRETNMEICISHLPFLIKINFILCLTKSIIKIMILLFLRKIRITYLQFRFYIIA